MSARSHRLMLGLFIFVVAPIGAAVVITALLAFGASPPLVFSPGRALIAALGRAGIHAPRPVGVLATVASFWAVIVAIGLLWDRIRGCPRIGP